MQTGWRAAGLGLDEHGAAQLACTPHPGARIDPVSGLPDRVPAHAASRTGMAHDLARIAAAGRAARWDLLQLLEPYVRAAVIRGHARVAAEVAGATSTSSRPAVLDDTDLEVVADALLLGEGAGPGPVARMLDRCLRPDTFRRVDPLRYIAVTLRRDAEQEIRRRIGDPRIGRKIRALHRQHPGISLPDLVAWYRSLYPQDRLSTQRAAAALQTSIRVRSRWMTRSEPRHGVTGPDDHHQDHPLWTTPLRFSPIWLPFSPGHREKGGHKCR